MSSLLLASKTVLREENPRVRNIVGVPTAVTAFVGVAERGPVNVATKIGGFDDYIRIFGSYTANAQDLPLAVSGFFENLGTDAYVVRVVHYSDITNPATKASVSATVTLDTDALIATQGFSLGTIAAPWALVPGDTLVGSVDGNANDTATFTATSGSRLAANSENFALTDGWTLTVEVDGGPVQTVIFNTAEFAAIGAATAEEVNAVLNAELTGISASGASAPLITSDARGTASSVEVTGGTAAAAFAFAAGLGSGTGNVADISAVTFAELKTIVEAAWTAGSGVTVTQDGGGEARITSDAAAGPAASILVAAVSTADDELGFDNATHSGTSAGATGTLTVDGRWDGTYANDVQIEIATASNNDASNFNLVVIEDNNITETFANLTMDDTLPNFVETVLNDSDVGSALITATDQDVDASPLLDRPVNGTFSLAAGDDGLTSLADADFIGSLVSATGFRALDTISDIRILTVPGRSTSSVHNAMLTYCESTRDASMFAILDCPEGNTSVQMLTYVKTTASLFESSEFGALYWPRIEIANPNTAIFGTAARIVVAPSGHIAGLYARNDAKRGGVYEAPAGLDWGEIIGAAGVETTEVNDESKRDIVFPALINPITKLTGEPVLIDGGRTLKSTGSFPTIGERRGIIFVEQSLKVGLKFSRHRKISKRLLGEMSRAARAFMIVQTGLGAFASLVPSQAFFVDFSGGPLSSGLLNTAATANARTTHGRIGVATAKPNEFTILSVSQDQSALEQEIALAA